jgi:AcrR family transcriptional regulator
MKPTITPRKQPKQARSQAMVETILAAATRVLTTRGYARTNTNAVAEEADISVGSLYQYFPNKDAIIAALHQRHAQQMRDLIRQTLADLNHTRPSLKSAMQQLIQAWMQAHQLAPELHHILESDTPVFAQPNSNDKAEEQIVFNEVTQFLHHYQSELPPTALPLTTYLVIKTIESLVHAIVIDPPEGLSPQALEEGILAMVMGYLHRANR